MLIKHLSTIALLVADHHGIEYLDRREEDPYIICYAPNDDILEYSIRVFDEHGFITRPVDNPDQYKEDGDGTDKFFEVRLDDTMKRMTEDASIPQQPSAKE